MRVPELVGSEGSHKGGDGGVDILLGCIHETVEKRSDLRCGCEFERFAKVQDTATNLVGSCHNTGGLGLLVLKVCHHVAEQEGGLDCCGVAHVRRVFPEQLLEALKAEEARRLFG